MFYTYSSLRLCEIPVCLFPGQYNFSPLNGQYIHGLIEYAMSPINLCGWNFPSIHVRLIFVTWNVTQAYRLLVHPFTISEYTI